MDFKNVYARDEQPLPSINRQTVVALKCERTNRADDFLSIEKYY